MMGVLMKRRDLDTDTHEGRTLCEHEVKDQGDASVCQETPNITSKLPEARRKT